MSFQRLALIAGWLVISLMAVAGFATFSAADVDVAEPEATIDTNIGRNAGAVSALAFAHTVSGSESPSTTIDFDLVLQRAMENRATTTTTTVAILVPQARLAPSIVMKETEVRALIERYFRPEHVNKAIRIAWCESTFNPRAVNPTSGAAGLFQHLPQFWNERSTRAGWPGADPFDPEANVAVAAWLLYEFPGTWEHWVCKA